jgi:hypothetical protein
MSAPIDVAAYIWPSYTGDEPRARAFWPEGMGEWETVRAMRPRFPGHAWPRKPLWGYCNEANPDVMRMQIDAAADHGVDVFLYDWYWFDGRPFLEQCLGEGFLKAPNNSRMRFYLMWANHDATLCWDRRLAHTDGQTVVWQGAVDRRQFEAVARRLIDRFFTHPLYYTIDGCPVFMIYDLANLVKGLGGVEAARAALDDFRAGCVEAGLPGLHLQLAYWNEWATRQGGGDGVKIPTGAALVDALGFDSLSHYQFCHATDIDRPYLDVLADMRNEWDRLDREYRAVYFPHISVGWDPSPRFQDAVMGHLRDTTPANIRKGFEMARDYLDAHPERHRLVTVNSWNEWTETSYLQPDDLNGYGYLEALRDVFGKA